MKLGNVISKKKICQVAGISLAASLLLAACKEKQKPLEKTVLRDSHLVSEKATVVPDSALKRGEHILVTGSKEINGIIFDRVEIRDSQVTGYLAQSLLLPEKLETLYLIRDSKLLKEANLKAGAIKSFKAGLEVLVLKREGSFALVEVLIDGAAVTRVQVLKGYVPTEHLGKSHAVVRTAMIGKLGLANVQSSTQLESQSGRASEFDVRNLFDQNFRSAWCDGKPNALGVGESVTIIFQKWLKLSQIKVFNGFKQFGKIKRLRLQGEEDSAFIDLENKTGWQSFDVDLGSDSFALIIDEVYPSKQTTVCFSELQLAGEFGEPEKETSEEEDPYQ